MRCNAAVHARQHLLSLIAGTASLYIWLLSFKYLHTSVVVGTLGASFCATTSIPVESTVPCMAGKLVDVSAAVGTPVPSGKATMRSSARVQLTTSMLY